MTSAVISLSVRGRPGVRAAIVLQGNQLSVPSQQRFRRDDGGNLFQQLAAEPLRFSCKTSPLVIIEPHPPRADLFSKDAILLDKVFDNGLLMLAHPASDRHDQKRERIQTCSHYRNVSRRTGG
jgi:hypothetical protein